VPEERRTAEHARADAGLLGVVLELRLGERDLRFDERLQLRRGVGHQLTEAALVRPRLGHESSLSCERVWRIDVPVSLRRAPRRLVSSLSRTAASTDATADVTSTAAFTSSVRWVLPYASSPTSRDTVKP